MDRKSYYGGKSAPAAGSKTAEVVANLHKMADHIHSDYEDHANTLRNVAKSLSMGGAKGKKGVREHRTNQSGSGQKKTNVAQGG